MDLAKLLALVPEADREAVDAFVTDIQGKVTSLAAEVAELERAANSNDSKDKIDQAIASRDAAKAKLTIVRETLGLPADQEITKELIADYLKDSSKGDAEKDRLIATLKTDIASLESTIEDSKTKLTAAESERDQISEETKFIKVFSENMPDFKAASSRARADIEKLMRADAVLQDGVIAYKGSDGVGLRVEGTPMTMKDRLAQLQADDDLAYLFESKASGGSGSGNGGSGGTVSKFEQRKRAANIS